MEALQFEPLLKTMIWGSEEVTQLKHISPAPEKVGESWEISALPGEETPVASGPLKGERLSALMRRYGAELVGLHNWERYGTHFPLLVKFIASAQDLSVQVHPDDQMARRMGRPFGKAEMWYFVRSAPEAAISLGFKEDFSAERYTESLRRGTFMEHVCRHATHAGDVFLVPAGMVHSIGAGNLLIEIQQTSNDTFRIYDYDRTDAQGRKRQLHVSEACEALDYKARTDYRTHYTPRPNAAVPLVECPHFSVRLYDLTAPVEADYTALDSFVILVAFSGEARLQYDEGELTLREGQTVLFPATTQHVKMTPAPGGFKALEAFC